MRFLLPAALRSMVNNHRNKLKETVGNRFRRRGRPARARETEGNLFVWFLKDPVHELSRVGWPERFRMIGRSF